jgi:hypothetical protein
MRNITQLDAKLLLVDVRSWLGRDIQPPEIDFRFTPKTGHSSTDVGFRDDYVCFSPSFGRDG